MANFFKHRKDLSKFFNEGQRKLYCSIFYVFRGPNNDISFKRLGQGFLTFFVSFTPFQKKEVQFTPSVPLLLFRY